MTVTITDWVWVLVTLLAAGAFGLGVLTLVHRRMPGRPLAETLLLTSLVVVLALYAEPYALSLIPWGRPLVLLPLFHVVLTIGLLWYVRRKHGRGANRATVRAIGVSVWAFVRKIGPILTVALVALLALLGLYAAYGAYSVPVFWDDLMYHIPMAIQPWQDGHIAVFSSDVPQLHLFPRGVEMLWYWCLQWSGTDLLFHPVLTCLGVQLLLAVYVLGRRLGAAPWAAVTAALAVASTPIFYLLSSTGYVDIAHAAAVVALAAFLAPDTDPQRRGQPAWGCAALALAEACIVKYPFLALIIGGVLAAEAVLLRNGPKLGFVHLFRFVLSWRGLASLAIVGGCAHTYISHYIHYKSPFYPYRIVVAGHEILPGPHDPGVTNYGGETSAPKLISEMSRFELYYYAWTDFRAPLTIESFGSFGEVFPFALLVPAFALCICALGSRNTPVLALTAGVILCLAFTPVAPPRYGLPVVSILFVFGMRAYSELSGRLRTGIVLVVLALGAVGIVRSLKHIQWWMRVYTQDAPLSWTARNRSFHEEYRVSPPSSCSRPMIRHVRAHAAADDNLVWAVTTCPTLLYNARWSNQLHFLPALPEKELWPAMPGQVPLPPDRLDAWLKEVVRLAPRFVLVYAGSDYVRGLSAHPELGYHEVFRDTDPARKEFAMALFERRAPVATTSAPATCSAPASLP